MNSVLQLSQLGQSLWLDYIRRDLIESGELAKRIEAGEVHGVTSNPSIFEKAIAETDLYTDSLRPMAQAGWAAERCVDALILDDIRSAADVFRPLFERTNGRDGFVSIEVGPRLAGDTQGSLREARRYWEAVNRPNLMVKIPATAAGIPAIEQATAEGININITLIFGLQRYAEVMEAYLRGLEARAARGAALDHVASVASFFVSRVDTKIDARLDEVAKQGGARAERAKMLRSKLAIANAKLAYAQFKAVFGSERFAKLAEKGARLQRPLWASTSTKDPSLPDTYYVDNLIGPDTVNTVPPHTLDAFRDHGTAAPTLDADLSAARAQLDALQSLGLSLREATDELEVEGVRAFAEAYGKLVQAVETKAKDLRKELAGLGARLEERLSSFAAVGVERRLWESDASLWTADAQEAAEVGRRMGWMTLPERSQAALPEIERLTRDVRAAGIHRAILLGMGGSSLAPDVFRRTLAAPDGLQFTVLDSTDPAMVASVTGSPKETLFIVSSKSGTTTEPLALLEYFWSRAARELGEKTGANFIAITDPGTPLERLAKERHFRAVLAAPPDVGGRYSVLSVFGLAPAALMGIDPNALLRGGERMARRCGPQAELARNPGVFLGAVIGEAAVNGRDRLTFVADRGLEPLEDWIEQLIAESSGKHGKGILPVTGEPPAAAGRYGSDRLFVYLRRGGELDARVKSWANAGHPVAVTQVGEGPEGLGAEFFRWEVAIATACHVLEVSAFDQPDVQRAKDRTAELLKTYRKTGSLPLPEVLWEKSGIRLEGRGGGVVPASTATLTEIAKEILGTLQPGDAVGLLAYLPADPVLQKKLLQLRKSIRDSHHVATTLGFGPRYLHSTGQYHKGGPARMLFLILTADRESDIPVPGMGVTFGLLQRAQAIGDLQALLSLGRRAYGFHLDLPEHLDAWVEAFTAAAGSG